MPTMDGMDLFDQLRAMNILVPVIMITGHPDPSILTRVTKAGLQLVEKPLSQDDLLSAVRHVRKGGVPRAGLGKV